MALTWVFVSFFPLIILFLAPLTIFLTYGIAVAKDHVYPLLPYVSDTGTKPPESCIFTFCLSASCFFLFIIIYVRYRELAELIRLKPSTRIKPIWNKIAFIIGVVTCMGLNVADSFQELHAFIPHFVGAVVCFFFGTVYFIYQTVFTRLTFPEDKALFYVRVVIITLNVLSLIGTFAPVHCALKEFKGEDILLWSEKDGGYEYHLLSAFSEWIMIFCFIAYMSTFYWDFSKFEMDVPAVRFKDPNLTGGDTAASKNPKV